MDRQAEASSVEEIKEQRNDEDDRNKHTEDRDILEIVNTIRGRQKEEGSLGGPDEQPCTIYQVHNVLSQVNEKCYEPQLASIGPYHRGKEGLKPMEEKKFQYLLALLSRNPELKLEDFVKEIKKLETKARKCYSESINLESKEFVEMMVFDGCFLVETFLRTCDITFDDGLWLPHFIFRDMLLLENQLPFFVLESIFSLVVPLETADSLKELLLVGCFQYVHILPLNKDAAMKESYHHVLDIFHHHCLPSSATVERRSLADTNSEAQSSGQESFIIGAASSRRTCWSVFLGILGLKRYTGWLASSLEYIRTGWSSSLAYIRTGWSVLASSLAYIPIDGLLTQLISKRRPPNSKARRFSIPSAEELEEAGIEFQTKETEATGSFLDVEFDKKGVLKIPFLYFSSRLQTIFQNLIAYEQCYPKVGTFFIGYGSFMDDLINTAKDVRILSQAGILENALGSDDQLAQHFNELAGQICVQVETTHLYSERRAINEYCRKRWPIWRAKLKRDYFSSPWAILSLIAAVVLLLLTITQTVFAIIPKV